MNSDIQFQIELVLNDVIKFHSELESNPEFSTGAGIRDFGFVILGYWSLQLMRRFKLLTDKIYTKPFSIKQLIWHMGWQKITALLTEIKESQFMQCWFIL